MKYLREKFQKIKFIIPIILGIAGLWTIYNFMPNRNTEEKFINGFFYFCDIWWSYLISKHWWKMARDEGYRKEREIWLRLPILERSVGIIAILLTLTIGLFLIVYFIIYHYFFNS